LIATSGCPCDTPLLREEASRGIGIAHVETEAAADEASHRANEAMARRFTADSDDHET
jgi:hypothetical protein